MVTYKELTSITMPPEKKASANRCIIGHYLVRPISNVLTLPLLEKHISPTAVTKFSGVFTILALFAFIFLPGKVGFWLGWIFILLWNIFDGIDGNIARYTRNCTKSGELWDASVGWVALIAFYLGMGFTAFYQENQIIRLDWIPSYLYLLIGSLTALFWIFPRLIMQKKIVLMGDESADLVKNRAKFNGIKLLFFNITSINGLAAVIFLLAYCMKITNFCMLGYFVIGLFVDLYSLFGLLK